MPDSPPTPRVDKEYFDEALKTIREKLLDKSRRSRLVNFRESARDVAIIDEMPNQIHDHLVLEGKRFVFDPIDEPDEEGAVELDGDLPLFEIPQSMETSTDSPSRELPVSESGRVDAAPRHRDDRLQTPFGKNDLERRLRKLYHEHRTIVEETGANNLYLAMGLLHWSDGREEATWQNSPLMLIPVRLERVGGAGAAVYYLVFDDEALDTNYCLYEKLRQAFDLKLPELRDDETPEDYWAEVDMAIATKRPEGWRIAREVVLGLFRFQKQVMWHDLDPGRWPAHSPLIDKDMIRRVLVGPSGGEREPTILDEPYDQDGPDAPELALIREADSSQFSALVDALHRQEGLVIEGPPGTGKSQTITNLIAAALAEGKTVLFLAEKMAALDVVFRQLDERGLGDFCMQLHGLRTGKKELLESVDRRMNRRYPASKDLARHRANLDLARQELIETSKALTVTSGPEGLQVQEIVWRVEKLRGLLPEGYESGDLKDPAQIPYSTYAKVKQTLDNMGREWAGIPVSAREAWQGFRPLEVGSSSEPELVDILESGAAAIGEAERELGRTESGVLLRDGSPSRALELDAYSNDALLPELPRGVPGSVILEVVRRRLVADFGVLIDAIERYLEVVARVNEAFDYAGDESADRAELLRGHCETLSGAACDPDLRIGDLVQELGDFRDCIQWLEEAAELASPVLALMGGFARTVKDCEHLSEDARALMDGPSDLFVHAQAAHALEPAKVFFSEARLRSARLELEGAALTDFDVSRIKDKEQILSAIVVVDRARDSILPILSSEYRAARRTLRTRMVNPKKFRREAQFFDVLSSLADFLRSRDEFAADELICESLGPLFKGMETDWERLGSLVDFSQKLRKARGRGSAREILTDWPSHAERMESASEALGRGAANVRTFASRHPFPDALWRRPTVEVAGVLRKWSTRVEESQRDLGQPWCDPQTTLEKGTAAAEAYESAKFFERSIESSTDLDFVIAECWSRSDTRLDPLAAAQRWINERLALTGMDAELLVCQFDGSGNLDRARFGSFMATVRELATLIRIHIDRLERLGELDTNDWLVSGGSSLDRFREKLERCRGQIEGVLLLARWEALRRRAVGYGCEAIADDLIAGRLSGEQCDIAFEYWVYSTIVSEQIQNSDRLFEFGRESYERLRERFADLDRQILELTATDIAAKLSKKRVPQGVGSGRVSTYTEASLLRREVHKKQKHIPIRRLVARAPNALQALKPCFLMSPLSVAQFLPPGQIEFDIVVMDEASQIRPEDALGALARARKAIVVGDPKQLPPTSFFDTAVPGDEDAEETALDDTESILEVCLKQFPFRRLRWHYRSEHEDLIRFSNEKFYDGDLVVFPSPRGDSRDFGVHSTFIEDPSYHKGRNRSEAERVVEAIVDHYSRCPEKTLGVAAFNKRQAEEIELHLDKTRRDDPRLDQLISEASEREPLFIKNLENVQGDERDVIFISTTYGPESAGAKTFQRFGPINSDLGWRRLNVIVTRARQRVEVFTSMRPSDVLVGEGARRGVRALRDYLEYAETGHVASAVVLSGGSYENEFEESIGARVEQLGYEVTPQVGVEGFFIDLGVRHPDRPGEFLLGIECDGRAYHSAPSVRDRDRLRQEILESKGWYIHRIWSTSWFHGRAAEIQRLEDVIEYQLEEDRRLTPPRTVPESSDRHLSSEADAVDEAISRRPADEIDALLGALTRFWEKNIQPGNPDQNLSILSDRMIDLLVRKLPETHEEWLAAIPLDHREGMELSQMEFLPGILEVVCDFA